MEALDGISHTAIVTVSVLSRSFLPLPDPGSCRCLLLLGSLPLRGRDWRPCPTEQPLCPLSPPRSAGSRGASPPSPRLGRVCCGAAVAGAHPGSLSRLSVALPKPMACPAALLCSSPQQKGNNYRRTLQKARGKGQGTFSSLPLCSTPKPPAEAAPHPMLPFGRVSGDKTSLRSRAHMGRRW